MTDFVTRAQLGLLASTLGVEPARVAHLERLGAEGVHTLRNRISDKLFDQHATVFARVSKLAPLVPNPVVAMISMAVVPPLAAGRAAGALGVAHEGRIADLLGRLKPAYMADCAPYLDPRAIAMLAPIVSGDSLVPAANELMRRHDYVTAAAFVEFATPELIAAFERGIADDLGLMRTAALVYSTDVLTMIIRAIPDERLERIWAASLGDDDATVAGLSVLSRIDGELRAKLIALAARHVEAGTSDRVFASIEEAGMSAELRPVAEELLSAVAS